MSPKEDTGQGVPAALHRTPEVLDDQAETALLLARDQGESRASASGDGLIRAQLLGP
jgi:hypothetical protein